MSLSPAARSSPQSPTHPAAWPAAPSTPSGQDGDLAFEAAVRLCEARARGEAPLSAELPRLLRRTFEADAQQLLSIGSHLAVNVTCMKPAGDVSSGYQCFDDDLSGLTLEPGRVCAGGCCSDACSRVLLPDFASSDEAEGFRSSVESLMASEEEHPHHNMYMMMCAAAGDVRATLTFMRLVERMRRFIAHQYGLRLRAVAPRQTFVSRIAHAANVERQSLHADESSFKSYHYSCVLYLSTQGCDFEGGGFFFSDPPPGADPSAERSLLRLEPRAGTAVVFSSGWENMHFVEPLESGRRFAVPAFFCTSAEADCEHANRYWPDGQTDWRQDDTAIAEALWRSALMPEREEDFRWFMARWHALLAEVPLSGLE